MSTVKFPWLYAQHVWLLTKIIIVFPNHVFLWTLFWDRGNCFVWFWPCILPFFADAFVGMTLTLFFTMFSFDSSENIRKLLVFWCFYGDKKWKLGRKWLKKTQYIFCYISVVLTKHWFDNLHGFYFWKLCNGKWKKTILCGNVALSLM